ncbi:MAG: hypothetical protein ACXABO_05680 [Promethearchaeota archaeon]
MNQTSYSNEEINGIDNMIIDVDSNNPEMATDTSMLQNPFTKNLTSLLTFFKSKYESSLDLDLPTYFRFGDINGQITDDLIFSEDNLLMYKTLMKSEIDKTETFDFYLKLKTTPLWYEDGNGPFNYGFVKSMDNATGQISNDDRYLTDNLLPIFLLIENIGDDIDDLSLNGKFPKDSIEEMFSLINSSQFWDGNRKAFGNLNSTYDKYSESNFYAILANLLIHRTYHQLNLDDNIKDRAYYLANQTMFSLENMWDDLDKGYYYDASPSWDTSGPGQKYYHLSTNAIAISTLLEFWIETGMVNDSLYFQRAVKLYNSLDKNLWDSGNNSYYNIGLPGVTPWNIFDDSFNLRSNSLMMGASLKLFELTGNYTYYERAVNLSVAFEYSFYDSTNEAYGFSLNPTNSSKNFNSNLKLVEAYLKASEIYESTHLISDYNITNEVPNFVFNQDIMNLTSVYSFQNEVQFYNSATDSYSSSTIVYNITDADISYLFKYPNGTFLYQIETQINKTAASHTLIETIGENFPIGEGYSIYIWANTTYFSYAESLKHFNVFSGLISKPIEGLVDILYQGPIVNITLPINYTRTDNLTLSASLEGENIINYPSRDINFTAKEIIQVQLNLSAKLGAIPGPSEIFITIKKDNILYLNVKQVIEIGYSFDYDNLIYQSKVVSGENIFVALNVINFLQNSTQSLNISFTGLTEDSIETFVQEEILKKREIITVSYFLKTLENIKNKSITIEMSISQNKTIFYSQEMQIQIIPKYEIVSVSFPGKIPQGASAFLVIVLQNNLGASKAFSLNINDELVQTNIDQLVPGENRIIKEIIPTSNPYEFGTKVYRITLIDSSTSEEIARFYFSVNLELPLLNLIIFYLLPAIIPIGIILVFVNKEIKHKKLRR